MLEPLLQWLEEHFPEAQPYLVGGSVRDRLLGLEPQDLDLEIIAIDPEAFLQALPWPVRTVGRSFRLQLLRLPDLGWVEVSLDPGRDWCQIARRRDFTCNAMALDLRSQRLLDPLGGQADLEQGQLQLAWPSSLQDDPLRAWRAAQFCARFDWQVTPQLHQALQQLDFSAVGLPAGERLTREWEKLLLLPARPSRGLELLRAWGLLAVGDPQLLTLVGCPQDPHHHPEGDVWTHTLMVVDQAAHLSRVAGYDSQQRLQVLLGALLHDLGKPLTTKYLGDRITAHGHEQAGVQPALAWLEQHHFGEDIRAAVLQCVRYHMRPNQLCREIDQGRLSPSQQLGALRRLRRELTAIDWETFLTLCQADSQGRGVSGGLPPEDSGCGVSGGFPPGNRGGEYRPGRLLNDLWRSAPSEAASLQPLLGGRDLLALGLKPGPEIGRLITRLEQARDQGLVSNKQEALELAGRWLGKESQALEPSP